MYAYQQKALVGCVGVGETGRADISVSNGVVCPKPRKLGFFDSYSVHVEEPIRPYQLMQFMYAPFLNNIQFISFFFFFLSLAYLVFFVLDF